ncbi:uncharacterized protein LOC144763132 [Lissotriton helveticus]
MVDVFIGTWKLVETVNFDEYMKALEVAFTTRQAGNVTKPTQIISKNGDKVTIRTESTFKNMEINFKLGEEFNETTVHTIDQHCQSVLKMNGNKLVHIQKWDGKETTFVREIKDGKMVMVQNALPEASSDPGHSIQPGDFVCWKNFQRKKNLEPRWGPPRQVILVTRTAVKVVGKKNWVHGVYCKRVPLPLPYDQWVREGVGDSESEKVPRFVPFSSARLDWTSSEKEDDDVLQEAVPPHLRLNTTNPETLFRDQTIPGKTPYNLRPRLTKDN